MKLSAYLSLIYYYSKYWEDDEIRRRFNEMLEDWLRVRKRE